VVPTSPRIQEVSVSETLRPTPAPKPARMDEGPDILAWTVSAVRPRPAMLSWTEAMTENRRQGGHVAAESARVYFRPTTERSRAFIVVAADFLHERPAFAQTGLGYDARK
jgi:hypothetical protein